MTFKIFYFVNCIKNFERAYRKSLNNIGSNGYLFWSENDWIFIIWSILNRYYTKSINHKSTLFVNGKYGINKFENYKFRTLTYWPNKHGLKCDFGWDYKLSKSNDCTLFKFKGI